MRGMHPPPAISKKIFDAYNFSIISNLFDSEALRPEYVIIENVRTKCIIFGETLRIRVKKFKQNLRENYSKSTKIVITAGKFSKFFRVSISPDPLKSFFFLARRKCRNYGLPF